MIEQRGMFVNERFVLNRGIQDTLRSMIPRFGYDGFGEFIFYRTYSRIICEKCRLTLKYRTLPNGEVIDYCRNCGDNFDRGQENWADCVIRVINGVFSIRKDWYAKNHIQWDEDFWQVYASRMATTLFKLHWSPPGRGLWAMGTDFVYERGSMALQNCGLTTIGETISGDISWLMDALMLGVGVGFIPIRDNKLRLHNVQETFDFVIPDSREGWCESVRHMIDSFVLGMPRPRMIYDKVRPKGSPIRGFGGVSSGPEPLMWFHDKIREYCERFHERKDRDSIWLKTCLANAAGCCVVAGNVRRSAELGAASITDPTFKDLKRYDLYPERADIGWMSNNSVFLDRDSDFEYLGEIADRARQEADVGYINRINLRYGRIGKLNDHSKPDNAIGFNPCAEQPLADKELCTLAETMPTVCNEISEWYTACEYATMYATTVTLLPTHSPETNKIMAKNRRIGVSIIDYTGWKHKEGVHRVTRYLRTGFKKVRGIAKISNEEAGIPLPIRHTTMKPGGTIPKLPGKTPGMNHPTSKWTLRRVRIGERTAIAKILDDAGIPSEPDVVSMNTRVYEWPIVQGPARPAEQVTIWEQAMNLILLQREWSDNAVSNTLYFKPRWVLILESKEAPYFFDDLTEYVGEIEARQILNSQLAEHIIPGRYKIKLEYNRLRIYEYNPDHEEHDIEAVLSAIAPVTKSVSLLPHSPKGVYPQMPEEGITEVEYEERKSKIRKIDWSKLKGSDGEDEKYCQGDVCVIPTP